MAVCPYRFPPLDVGTPGCCCVLLDGHDGEHACEHHETARRFGHGPGQLAGRYWPDTPAPLRLDGSLDVSAWCAQLDAAANAATGAGEPRT